MRIWALSRWPTAETVFEAGMVVTVEPILTTGSGELVEHGKQWGARTADGSPAAYLESMVGLRTDGPVVCRGFGAELERGREVH